LSAAAAQPRSYITRYSRPINTMHRWAVKRWHGIAYDHVFEGTLGYLHNFIPNQSVFTALHGMQTRSSDENSVCLSVRLSNAVAFLHFFYRIRQIFRPIISQWLKIDL